MFETAGTIISDAALELGLVSTAITDPFGSLDPNVLQLCALINSAGKRMLKAADWGALTATGVTFNTAVGAASPFLSPSIVQGFDRFVDGTVWNTTTKLPLRPMTQQQLAAMKAQAFSTAPYQYYLLSLPNVLLYPTPTAVQTISYAYIINSWVGSDYAGALYASRVTTKSDIPYFDSDALRSCLKMLFLQAKGFDSSAAREEYQEALEIAKGGMDAKPALSITGNPDASPLLTSDNVPVTSFGT